MREGDDSAAAGYTSWGQVSGFFDGDGCVCIEATEFVLRFSLRWSDTYIPQVEQIRRLMIEKGFTPASRFSRTKTNTCSLMVIRRDSVLEISRKMVACTFKKREELLIVVDYLTNRITGNRAIESMNERVTMGVRSGNIRTVDQPWVRAEGIRLARLRVRLSSSCPRVLLNAEVMSQVWNDYSVLRLSIDEIARRNELTPRVVEMILGLVERRGTV